MTGAPTAYRAFISYSHKDAKWGRWLHRSLETYSVPGSIRRTQRRRGQQPLKRLYPVYRDREELPSAADLPSLIRQALENSAFLIVICSPNSVASRWVNEEILTFKRLGRSDRILALIVDGEPNVSDKADGNAALEAFPRALRFKFEESIDDLGEQRSEPVAADARAHADGKHEAKLKLIAGLLGVGFDAIRRREEGRRVRRALAAAALIAAPIGAGGYYAYDRYDRGVFEAQSFPVQSAIDVDGVTLGAHIENLSLRAGDHHIVAWAPDHFERRDIAHVPRQGRLSGRYWLEQGVIWQTPQVNTTLQQALLASPARGSPVLAESHDFGVVFTSPRDGRQLASIPAPDGTRRSFRVLSLDGDIGDIVVSGYARQGEAAEALVMQVSAEPRILWRWQGGLNATGETHGLSVVSVPVRDQATAIGFAGSDGSLWVHQASDGSLLRRVELTRERLLRTPDIAVDGEAIVVLGRVASGSFVRRLRLADSSTVWNIPLARTDEAALVQGVGKALIWSQNGWRILDTTTGELEAAGRIEDVLVAPPAFIATPNGAVLLLQSEAGVVALSAQTGERLWERTSVRPVLTADGAAAALNELALFSRPEELLAINLENGEIAWRVLGLPMRALVDDWNGDGTPEALVTIRGRGLVCLDMSGRLLWSLRLSNSEVEPFALLPSVDNRVQRDVLVRQHAGVVGLLQGGPTTLWETQYSAPLEATPAIARDSDGHALVIATGRFGEDVSLLALRGHDGARAWARRENIQPNRGVAALDWDDDDRDLDEIYAVGERRGLPGARLFSYSISGALRLDLPIGVNGWVSSTPTPGRFRRAARDLLISTFDDRSVLLVNAQTGRIVWRAQTGTGNVGGLGAGDIDGDQMDEALAASLDGHLYALHGQTGAVIWRRPIDGGGWSAPLLVRSSGEAQIAVTSRTGSTYVFRAADGAPRWSSLTEPGPDVYGRPVAARVGERTLLFAPTGQRGLVAFDLRGGEEVWRSAPGLSVHVSPVLAVSAREDRPAVLIVAQSGEAWLLAQDTGRPLWRNRAGRHPFVADPVLADLDGDGVRDILLTDTGGFRALSGEGIIAR